MLVSVVIPTKNREVFLKRALESVFQQSISIHEVIMFNSNVQT